MQPKLDQETTPNNLLEEPLKKFEARDPEFRLFKVLDLLKNTVIEFDETKSMSIFRRSVTPHKIIIGTLPYDQSIVEQWNMGTKTDTEQIMIKLSHELAHAYQDERGYEQALIDYCNGANEFDKDLFPFVELYLMLESIGVINPLVEDSIYEQPDFNTIFNMRVFEDVTELMSAYLISDEYFLYRLGLSKSTLDDEQRTFICRKVIEVFKEIEGE